MQIDLLHALHRGSAGTAQFKALQKHTKKNPVEDPTTEQRVIRHPECVTDSEKTGIAQSSEEKVEGDTPSLSYAEYERQGKGGNKLLQIH